MKTESRLRGRTVFLSASVPGKGSGWENARLDLNVDEAVITLARTVFAEGGRLVFGGHPSISPLVLTIASEYAPARPAGEPLALIYQSEIFRPVVPEQTLLLMQLGYGRIVWTPPAEGEVLTRDANGRYHVPRSLERMRRAMISDTNAAAFVAAGGMEGIEEEVKLFHELRPEAPVFAIASTGGAAATLAGEYPYVVALDRQVESLLGHAADVRPAAIYPVVMDRLVAELCRPGKSGHDR